MITNISIRNFRSIDRLEIGTKSITSFVGANDAGKSNILRALNLFFNGKTDAEMLFDFPRDFNQFAIVPTRKAKQIEITITFLLPVGYRRNGFVDEVIWKKVWRRDGLYSQGEVRKYADEKDLLSRSKISTMLDRIKYSYVPAIKDRDFLRTYKAGCMKFLRRWQKKNCEHPQTDFRMRFKKM